MSKTNLIEEDMNKRCLPCIPGDHAPSRPEVSVRGRCELFVSWKPPPVPMGRINRYDLSMDGNCIYSGTDLHFCVCRLKPDTEYTFLVNIQLYRFCSHYALIIFVRTMF